MEHEDTIEMGAVTGRLRALAKDMQLAILIVDDDAELRDALTEQLSLHEEFEAVAAENGSKGVQKADFRPYQVVG